MSKSFFISLNEGDLGQVLDGLEVREKAWRATAKLLETGVMPERSFVAEDYRDAEEANWLAERYANIGAKIRKQRDAQRPPSEMEASPNERGGFCIFVDSAAEGLTVLERDATDRPVIYATRRAAETELADMLLERLHEFFRGERNFEDAVIGSEYIQQVRVLGDGNIEPI